MASVGLDCQRITSHLTHRKLPEFDNDGGFESVKSDCIRHLNEWGYHTKADKFDKCSEDYAVFECNECDKEFSAPITCGLRVCPSCRSRLRGVFVEELEKHIKNVKNHRHMVLTIPNLPSSATVRDIQIKIKEIKENLGKLRRRAYFDKRVKGLIYGIEVKEGSNGFNIHLHCFIALVDWVKESYQFNYKKVAGMWLDYFPDAVRSAQEFREHKGSKTALVEVVSYATKGAYFETGLNMAKWVVATNTSRLIGRTGCFFNLPCFREKKYVECPYCGSKKVRYVGRWSEVSAYSVVGEPPPTVNEVKGEIDNWSMG